MFYSDKRLLSEYAISVAMRWQCCDKFTAQSYKQDLHLPCPADGVSGIAQTDILLLIFYVLRYLCSVPTPKLLRTWTPDPDYSFLS